MTVGDEGASRIIRQKCGTVMSFGPCEVRVSDCINSCHL